MKCESCKYYWNNGKDEYCDKRGWDFKRIDCPDFASKYKPETNADRIRAMTDEQLAKACNDYFGACPPVDCPESNCEACWLEWLKIPAEEGE